MNEIFIYQDQRQKQRHQIIRGSEEHSHSHSCKYYAEKERLRQKNQNYLISSLKKSTKSVNPESKKHLYFRTVSVMNSYLPESQQFVNIQPIVTPEEKAQSAQSAFISIEEEERLIQAQKQKSSLLKNISVLHIDNSKADLAKPKPSANEEIQKIEQQIEQNFYQLYINTYVTFFNHKSLSEDSKIKPEFIKGIIRPNNRFVLMDLLKALFEYARKDFKELLSQTTFHFKESIMQHQIKTQGVEVTDAEQQGGKMLQFLEEQCERESQDVELKKKSTSSDFQSSQVKRRIQTEPEIQPCASYQIEKAKIMPKMKQTTLSVAHLKEESTVSEDRSLFPTFIEYQVKQSTLERNSVFSSQLNLEKLESRMSSLFQELIKLNYANSDMIDRYFEHAIGRKQKFNYDCRGLYTEQEKDKKKEFITFEILKYETLQQPDSKSSKAELSQYAESQLKRRTYYEELRTLQSKKGALPYRSSPWMPLCCELSNSVFNPLNLCVYEINALSSQPLVYHWMKYRKQYQLSEFMKEKVKSAYQCSLSAELLSILDSHDKKALNRLFKKFKFRKNQFIATKKCVNEILQYQNNLVISKKQSIFPALKGIQENFMRSSGNRIQTQSQTQAQISTQTKFSLGTISSKNIDRVKQGSNNQMKGIENSEKKIPQLSYMRSTGQRKDDSKSQRKLANLKQREACLNKSKKDRPEFLTRLVAKYDINPPKIDTPQNHEDNLRGRKDKKDKKNMISMTRITSSEFKKTQLLKTKEINNKGNSPFKTMESSNVGLNSNGNANVNKLSILNLLEAEECVTRTEALKDKVGEVWQMPKKVHQ